MNESQEQFEVKIGSEKGFGIIFSIVFLLIGLYPLLDGSPARTWSIAISVILLVLAFLFPKMLSQPNRWWFKFGLLLGSVIAPVIMSLVYLLAVIPTGLLMKFLGKDLLRLKLDKSAESYWIKRDQTVSSMKDQF